MPLFHLHLNSHQNPSSNKSHIGLKLLNAASASEADTPEITFSPKITFYRKTPTVSLSFSQTSKTFKRLQIVKSSSALSEILVSLN